MRKIVLEHGFGIKVVCLDNAVPNWTKAGKKPPFLLYFNFP